MTDKINTISNSVYDKGFSISENFFDEQGVNILLDIYLSQKNNLKLNGIGNKENFKLENKVRSDKIKWIERNESAGLDHTFYKAIDELIISLNRKCYLGINDSEFHFANYEPGAFYKKHRDAFSNKDTRKISSVLYLNKNWQQGDGGELNIYMDNLISVKPVSGTLVIFESSFEHEVLESNKDRISLTGWLKRSD